MIVVSEVKAGRKSVIITKRKDHIDTLNQYLKQTFETITLNGDDPGHAKYQMENAKRAHFQVLILPANILVKEVTWSNYLCISSNPFFI